MTTKANPTSAGCPFLSGNALARRIYRLLDSLNGGSMTMDQLRSELCLDAWIIRKEINRIAMARPLGCQIEKIRAAGSRPSSKPIAYRLLFS